MLYIVSMRKIMILVVLLMFGLEANGQIQRTSRPLGDSLTKALAKVSITAEGAQPFHIRVDVSEPENPQSPYKGSIEEWWSSPAQWRREVSVAGGMHQTIVVVDGKKSEVDEGDYYPLWLRGFVIALFDPVPDASMWTASGVTIDQTILPNGYKSEACARLQSKIGTGPRATDAFSNVCFDDEGRLELVGSPRYNMEFKDYRKFEKKQIARKLRADPEPGTALYGDVVLLEKLSGAMKDRLFTSLPSNDGRFESVEPGASRLEEMTSGDGPVVWPAVRSGNLHGNLAVYVSIDNQGRVREAWPLNSDNASLNDPARDQVGKWSVAPVKDAAGNPVQVDGGLGFSFETVIENPIPVLSDEEARKLLIKSVEPTFPPDVPRGTRYRVRILVTEEGHAGVGASGDTEIPGTIKPPGPSLISIVVAMREWRFNPLIQGGKPQPFFAELVIVVK